MEGTARLESGGFRIAAKRATNASNPREALLQRGTSHRETSDESALQEGIPIILLPVYEPYTKATCAQATAKTRHVPRSSCKSRSFLSSKNKCTGTIKRTRMSMSRALNQLSMPGEKKRPLRKQEALANRTCCFPVCVPSYRVNPHRTRGHASAQGESEISLKKKNRYRKKRERRK